VIFFGDKDDKLATKIETEVEQLGKTPSVKLVSRWLRPPGMKSTLEQMTLKDIDKLAQKQNLLIENGLVNLRDHYQAFEPSEPGQNKEI
jgi:hypothetical protein